MAWRTYARGKRYFRKFRNMSLDFVLLEAAEVNKSSEEHGLYSARES